MLEYMFKKQLGDVHKLRNAISKISEPTPLVT
jgi:hypothetical protein